MQVRIGNIAAKNKDSHLHHGNVLNITEKGEAVIRAGEGATETGWGRQGTTRAGQNF